jgi:hypothetical protein
MNIISVRRKVGIGPQAVTVVLLVLCGCAVPMTAQALASDIGLLPDPVINACWVRDADEPGAMSDEDWNAATDAIEDLVRDWERASGVTYNWTKSCPSDWKDFVLRAFLDEGALDTTIPGCDRDVSDLLWWGTYPDNLDDDATCAYTLRVGPGLPRNKYLHEFGHSLGFLHEHDRSDRTCTLLNDNGTPFGAGTLATRLLTPFDPMSVMHYAQSAAGAALNTDPLWQRCNAANEADQGNYGPTPWDQLGAEIAYPRSDSNQIVGQGIHRSDVPVLLRPEHIARGARTGQTGAYWDFSWIYVNSEATVSTAAELTMSFTSTGFHSFIVTFRDAWDRPSTRWAGVTVFTPPAHTAVFSSHASMM